MQKKLRVAIAGAPSAGKKALVNILGHTFCNDVVPVAHAASILFQGGFQPQTTDKTIFAQERAIYHLQRELETIADLQFDRKALLCSGGSFDCLAFLESEHDRDEFFSTVGSSLEAEIERYDWVIQIGNSENGAHPLSRAWSRHPNRILLPVEFDFEGKVNVAIRCLSRILNSTEETEQLTHDGSTAKAGESNENPL